MKLVPRSSLLKSFRGGRHASSMRAITFADPGGPDVLRATDNVAVPEPGPGELLIKVAYAGVNRPDVAQRSGIYPPPPGASPILGLEVSGTVAAMGPGVGDWASAMGSGVGDWTSSVSGVPSWAVGADVCGLAPGGGYAEYCVLPAAHALPIPLGFSLEEAAALPETMFTVWHNVFQRGGLQPNETLLVHGGSSGIGTTAIQVATAMGSKVVVTAGSDEKCAACMDLGATAAINYKSGSWEEAVREATGGSGVDVLLDMIGGKYFDGNLKMLNQDGRLVIIG